eukprot:gene10839-10995_t
MAANGDQQPLPAVAFVVDPRLSAGRGELFSAGSEADEDRLDDGLPSMHWYPEGQQTQAASTSTAIDESNKGFKLLQKMGWSKGKGLGKQETGVVEPVAAGVDAGVRLGLGKQQEDDKFTAAEGIARKKLEVELQADEDPERTKRREAQAQRDEQIKQDVTEILKTFYCQVCNKQYTTAMELEEHLSSYDHHHKKRLAEARTAEMERTRDERARKEQRRQQREQQRLEEQIRRARAAASQQHAPVQAVQPPLPPLPSVSGDAEGGWASNAASAARPPPPPPQAQTAEPAAAAATQHCASISDAGLSIGLKRPISGRGGAAGGFSGLKRPAHAVQGPARQGMVKAAAVQGASKSVNAAFAESSSEDEGS